ncbi:Rod shape-determining protein MreC [Stanieria sp. NIES-3757]|nr:Rod shape-determining protein MreC [Stanieria sp. NIES-3757]
MHRWWDRYGFQATVTVAVISIAWLLKQSQTAVLTEAYYFLVSPLQSKQQLILEDRLSNARILELEQQVTELKQENQQFKQLINSDNTKKSSQVIAPIIGRSIQGWWNQVTLGKGSQDGIQPGFIVSGIGGVVGRVIQVTPHTSRVALISDPDSRVGAIVSRNRQFGFIQGKDSQTLVMRFFTKVSDLKPGDAIATSNLSNLYPPGLPIGTVKSVNFETSSVPEAEVELTAPIDVLEWVVVDAFKPKLNLSP